MDNLIFVAAAIAVIAVIIILVLITGYVKAPTDTAVIISGLKKEPKYVIGRSSIKIPFLQRTDKLTLKMISVDVKTEESVPTNDYINVNIDSAVKVKVSMDPEKMKLAASNFLNKNEEYIRSSVVDVLQGNVREIIGQMKLEEIVQDRKKFADKVQENAAPDMAKMGLDIVSGGTYIEVSNNYRASQYDHTADDYIKKKLSDRMYKLADGTLVQRDWYSSFLLYCYDFRTSDIDKDKCAAKFDKCYSMERKLIEWIKTNKIKVLNSGIKIA